MKFSDDGYIFNGLTTIKLTNGGKDVLITHTGNMGNTEDRDVRPNVDGVCGKGAYNQLRKVGKAEGSPTYLFTLQVSKEDFDKVCTK